MSVITGKTANIITFLSWENKKQAEENRKKQISIVETVILYGCQEIALRGKNGTDNIGITEPSHDDVN